MNDIALMSGLKCVLAYARYGGSCNTQLMEDRFLTFQQSGPLNSSETKQCKHGASWPRSQVVHGKSCSRLLGCLAEDVLFVSICVCVHVDYIHAKVPEETISIIEEVTSSVVCSLAPLFLYTLHVCLGAQDEQLENAMSELVALIPAQVMDMHACHAMHSMTFHGPHEVQTCHACALHAMQCHAIHSMHVALQSMLTIHACMHACLEDRASSSRRTFAVPSKCRPWFQPKS